MSSERRSNPRRNVVWKAIINRTNGEQFMGSTANISSDGIFVIVDRPLFEGEILNINVVSKCTGRACFFSLNGQVVYNRILESNLGNAIGLRLRDPQIDYLNMLSDTQLWPLKTIAS